MAETAGPVDSYGPQAFQKFLAAKFGEILAYEIMSAFANPDT